MAPSKYEDFFLRFATARNGYAVHAWSSRGEGSEPFVLPPEDGKEAPETTGERLFDALFTGRVLRLYERTLARLEPGSGLRLKLMIDPFDPELGPLQALPWELMRQPDTPEFLVLNRLRSLVRHLWIPEPVSACPRPERLRILVVAACPRGRESLDLEGEFRGLKEALADSGIEIAEPVPATLAGMRAALLAQPCHVLHFIGHGSFAEEGILWFEDDDRSERPVSGTELVNKLAGFPALRLVVLNACRSAQAMGGGDFRPFASVAGSLVMGGVPAVVAMRAPIFDDTAAEFSRAFYGRLAAGDPVDAAVGEGRQAIPLADGEWAIPVLFQRTPEGELFPARDLHPPPPPPPPWTRFAKWVAAAALAALAVFGIWLGCLWWLVADGAVHLENKNPEKARQRFEVALALAPRMAEIHADFAAAAEQMGDDEVAEEHYREAVRLRPETPVHLFNLGHFLNERRQFQEAYKWLGRGAKILRKDSGRNPELDRDRVDTYGELARAALYSGGLTEARVNLEAALVIDPDRAPLHRLLGEVALRGQDARAAVGHLQAALDRYPRGERGRIETQSLLVEAYDRLGDPAATCRAVEQFQLEDPAGITPWALSVEGIAQRRSCPRAI